MAELLLDPAIRMWVILPIVFISLLFGLLRHYVMVLLRSDNGSVTQEQIKDRYYFPVGIASCKEITTDQN